MRILTVTDSKTNEVIEHVEGTFIALVPTSNGVRMVAEGDLTPFAAMLRPIIDRLFQTIMPLMMKK